MMPPRSPIPVLSALPLELETARLRLRPHREDDVELLWPFVSDPALPRLMVWEAHATKEATRAWVTSQIDALAQGSTINWVIERDGALVGTISLASITWQVAAVRVDRAELGYWMATDARNAGLMTEAGGAVLRFGFEELGLHKITVGAAVENAASRRVIEKLGFRSIGRRRDDMWRDGRWFDQDRYELCVDEWAARA